MGQTDLPLDKTNENGLLIELVQREANIDIRNTSKRTFNAIKRIINGEWGQAWHTGSIHLHIRLTRDHIAQIIQLMKSTRK